MFIRKKQNKSGAISIQVIDKSSGIYRVRKSLGSAKNEDEIKKLEELANDYIESVTKQGKLNLGFSEDASFVKNIKEGFQKFILIGPELVLGKLFDDIGYNIIQDNLFRHLVITRLVYPGSKLKTVDYLIRYKGIYSNKDRIYRYMDKFNKQHQQTIIDHTFHHTKKMQNDTISIAFYDVTTLYFEASDEDDLRKAGFSKDGKAQHPQILLALLVSLDGHPLAYEVFEGAMFEGHTFIPVIQTFKKKYKIENLIVVADAGLLSSDNIREMIALNYPFILGGRIKNESETMKKQILNHTYADGTTITFQKENKIRLIVNYSAKRAEKDEHNRKKGMQKLEKKIKSGKISKDKITNRGYNKYLIIKNKIEAEINFELFKEDGKWNGLKGYVSNSNLTEQEILDNYKHLWAIEKAFRISKTDLRVRPIYHRLERRIKTHICLAFCSYKLYKELERFLKNGKSEYSVEQVLTILKSIFLVQVQLPMSKASTKILIPTDEDQKKVLDIFKIPY